MRDTDLAWAAGIFEGEGFVGIQVTKRASGPRGTIRVGLGQIDRDLIETFHGWWGGSVSVGTPVGNRRPSWLWRAVGTNAAACLTAIRPFMRVARVIEKVDFALAFHSRRTTDDHAAYIAQMRTMNLRGVQETLKKPVQTTAT
jgi:hypothetical protein